MLTSAVSEEDYILAARSEMQLNVSRNKNLQKIPKSKKAVELLKLLLFYGKIYRLIGIVFILLIAFLMSNNRKAINKRLVITGLLLQLVLAIFILKVPLGQQMFAGLGYIITRLLDFAMKGRRIRFRHLLNRPLMEKVLVRVLHLYLF